MFQDPDMPDFDSMSQEELIQWLETLSRRQQHAQAEAGDDYDPELDELYPEPELLNDEEWSAWIEEEDLQQETPPITAPRSQAVQDLDEDDDETPTSMPVIDEASSDDTTDPLTELEDLFVLNESAAAEQEDVDPRQEAEDQEDPLEWLESLASEVSEAALDIPVAGQEGEAFDNLEDIDDAWEDDERHEDAEDESLYARGLQESRAFLDSLEGFDDEEEYSTQSMAPLPDELIPESEAPDNALEDPAADLGILAESRRPAPRDNLMQAFLLQDHEADLEAWYEARLRAIAGGADTAVRSAADREFDLSALVPPPPGLSAGFNSARGKLADGRLEEALSDYETILRANIGLDLVVGDMRWLLAQTAFRSNPTVHRVLGDALMRQGLLQAALDVYQQALKLL